ncbi:MAG TPA: DUF4268 domain-containing protein [Gemmataceae bacterium]|nr:DUF4268 domain-containing protein [Gemmataceae bacterium]
MVLAALGLPLGHPPQRVTEEHRAALDWLNQVTAEHIHFFGLEIELWRIGGSPPAPKFNVVSKPNDWARVAASTARQIESGSPSPREQAYRAFWLALAERIQATGSALRHGAPRGYSYFLFATGRTDFKLIASFSRGELWAQLLCYDAGYWPALNAMKAEVERESGISLTADFKEGRQQNYLTVFVGNVDLEEPESWPAAIADLQGKLEKLHAAFGPRVRGLKIEPTIDGSDGDLTRVEEPQAGGPPAGY